jgi:hypothetical protein
MMMIMAAYACDIRLLQHSVRAEYGTWLQPLLCVAAAEVLTGPPALCVRPAQSHSMFVVPQPGTCAGW